MPQAEESQVYLELTQYSLHALRAVGGVVEAGGECVLENKASLEALLDSVAPGRKTEGMRAIASVWPAAAQWYLSTDTEAMLDRTEDAVKAIAAGKQKNPESPFAYALSNATDGGKVSTDGMDRWVIAFSPVESLESVSKGLMDLKVDPDDVKPAAFSGVAALIAALKLEGTGGSVVLWDIGSYTSNLVLVTEKGVEGTAACDIGMEGVFEAVQNVLKLKFRGAGARLFFNEGYDFSDPGPKVGALVGAVVKEALAVLPPLADTPRLACMGLTGKQAWFLREVAAAAGLTPWEPDMPQLAAALGLGFSDEALKEAFTSTSASLLALLSMRTAGRDAWNADWAEAEGQKDEISEEPAAAAEPESEPEPEAAEPEPIAPAPVAPIRAKPSLSTASQGTGSMSAAPRPSVSPRSVTAPPMPGSGPKPAAPRAASTPPMAPPPVTRPSAAAPSAAAPAPDFPARTPGPAAPSFPSAGGAVPSFPAVGTPTPKFPSAAAGSGFPEPGAPAAGFPAPGGAARPPSFSSPGFPVPGGAPAPAAASNLPPPPGLQAATAGAAATPVPDEAGLPRPVTALPFEAAAKLKGLPAGSSAPFKGEAPPPPPPAKSRIGFFIGAGVVGALLFAGIAVVVEARLERIKAHDLEQQETLKAHMNEELLEKQEKLQKEQAAQDEKEKAIEVAAARKAAEEDTRKAMLAQFEAERVAKLPGTILLSTMPAGATVTIDGGTPFTSPVRATGIEPGPHKVHIALLGRDPVDLAANLKGGATLNLGSVMLQAAYGGIDLTSVPDGLDFQVRAASEPAGKPVRTGRTPASLEDLMHGDYVVTFMRPGCRDHNEKATVQKGATTPVTTTYLDGSLELSSDPSGANVNKDGTFLGTTPLTLHDMTPKVASFVLTLPGYDSTPVSCEIPEGQTLKYSAQILRQDRIFNVGEAKTPARKLSGAAPVLSASQRRLGGDVLIAFVVSRYGMVRDVSIAHATDDDIARRCKAAVEQWKFSPATADDERPVDSRVEAPFTFPANAP